jgi:hypothetical protein
MMGELKYFLGFQVKQLQEGTFISQTKYTQDILNKFGMKDAKPIKTLMGTNGHLDLDTADWKGNGVFGEDKASTLLYRYHLPFAVIFHLPMGRKFAKGLSKVSVFGESCQRGRKY